MSGSPPEPERPAETPPGAAPRPVLLSPKALELLRGDGSGRPRPVSVAAFDDPSLRTPWLTPLLIVANVLVFALMMFDGVSAYDPKPADLLRWGGSIGDISLRSEPWRLATCMFVHAGLLHLAVNMYALYMLGGLAERIMGRPNLLVLYVLSGLTASLASAHWHADQRIVSVGASGAILGIQGGIVSYLLLHRRTFSPRLTQAIPGLLGNAVITIVVMMFLMGRVDHAAHIGGLVGGLLVGFLLCPPRVPRALALRLGWVAVLFALGMGGLETGRRMLTPPKPFDFQEAFRQYNALTDRTEGVLLPFEKGQADAALTARRIAEELVPAHLGEIARWHEAERRGVAPLGLQAIGQAATCLELRLEALRRFETLLREPGPLAKERSDNAWRDFHAASAEFHKLLQEKP